MMRASKQSIRVGISRALLLLLIFTFAGAVGIYLLGLGHIARAQDAGVTARAQPAGPASCPPAWEQVPVPDPPSNYDLLMDVATVAPNDIWAVGSSEFQAQALHWDGAAWTSFPLTQPDTYGSHLAGISALSSTSIWAVGRRLPLICCHDAETLIAHWNGSDWTTVTVNPANADVAELTEVYAVAANNVWAVGTYAPYTDQRYRSLILHWDGFYWDIVPSPSPTWGDGVLSDVSLSGATDGWAVGSVYTSTTRTYQTLALRMHNYQWSSVPSPNPGSSNSLRGVASVSANDAWAVGYTQSGTITQTLITRWNGANWAIMPGPSIPGNDSRLYSVVARSANDVWAVGSYMSGQYPQPLAIHWNGTVWSMVAAASAGQGGTLSAAASLSPYELWAVGSTYDAVAGEQYLAERYRDDCATPTSTPTSTETYTPTGTPPTSTSTPTATATLPPECAPAWVVAQHPPSGTLADISADAPNDAWALGPGALLRWDGLRWSYAPQPVPTEIGTLSHVSASAADNVWVLGSLGAARWDGTNWAAHPVPTPTAWPYTSYTLYDIAARAPDDVFVTGHANAAVCEMEVAVIFHWNGSSWDGGPSYVLSDTSDGPDGATCHSLSLFDVVATGPNEMWSVGYETTWPSGGYTGPFVVHCSASSCHRVSGNSFPSTASFNGVAALSPYDAWVVGTDIYHWDGNTLAPVSHPQVGTLSGVTAIAANNVWAVGVGGILHWDGKAWTQVPAPSGAVAVSGTAADDIWAAGVNILHYPDLPRFTDVPTSDPFYRYIQDLACRGSISGYSDGTFRPYNNTTRGQLSKIVVLAEGWPIVTPTGTPTFQDVPPGNPFYGYIETAYSRGIISGYSCGTDCLEFRWANNITRGQLAKVVVLAQNWAITPPSQPTFIDVPLNHPFFGYIETAYAHQIISGYSCGADCLEFRPYNNATRGQIAKIVYNAITGP